MLRFIKEGKEVMNVKDSGEVNVQDQALKEQFEEKGALKESEKEE